MRLGIVCVHYHAAELAVRAVQAALRGARQAGCDAEIVIVDNGSTAEEAHRLHVSGFPVATMSGNGGYAVGVNAGARRLEFVDAWIFMNPDVLVEPGCIERLVEALRGGAAVAGPRFFWDRPGGFQLPPTERSGRLPELGRIWSSKRPVEASRQRGRWRRHARLHWQAEGPLRTYDLSGALLAIRADAWRRVGPFDEGYRLYFEETDWLCRCRDAGEQSLFIPQAQAVHLYAQSTPDTPKIARWFSESQSRFRELHYGKIAADLMGRLARRLPDRKAETVPEWSPDLAPADADWLEISPSPAGFPAAGRQLDGSPGPWISEELLGQMAPGTYFLRFLKGERETASYRLERKA